MEKERGRRRHKDRWKKERGSGEQIRADRSQCEQIEATDGGKCRQVGPVGMKQARLGSEPPKIIMWEKGSISTYAIATSMQSLMF